MATPKTPESVWPVRQHGGSVEGSGVRGGAVSPSPRRPASFPLAMPDLPIDGAGLAIARALRESA